MTIRVSASTNMCSQVLWNQEYYSSEDAIRAIAAAGYGSVDLDLAFWGLCSDPMAGDDWRDWVERQIGAAQTVGLPMTQGHAHFYGLDHCERLTDEENELRARTIERDIEAAGMCRIPWLVIHPESFCDGVWYSRKLSMERNLARFRRLGEKAAKFGVGLAIENMFIHSIPCFAASSEDLVELVDRLGDDRIFGICWDTGHGNLNHVDQAAAVRQMGHRLKALHVNDNRGTRDEHILPFQGTISWEPFMKALGETGYAGALTYEIHNFTKGFDPGFHHEAMVFARRLGEHLASLM